MNQQKSSVSAFSLIELSIVLVVIAILVGGLLSVVNTQMQSSYVTTTGNNLQVISAALEKYFATNGNLPCPADLNVAVTDQNYGKARVNSTTGSPDTCIINPNSLFSFVDNNEVIYMGAVPVYTLGLVGAFMYDGWDNKITYIVQRSFINGSNTSTCAAATSAADVHTTLSNICPRGQASGSVNPASIDIEIWDHIGGRMVNNDAVYVLISHGQNGRGAFLRTADGSGPNTDRNPLPNYPSQLNELNNTNCSVTSATCASNVLADQTFSMNGGSSEAATFDDIVVFRTRNQLIYSCNYNNNNKCTSGGDDPANRQNTDLR